MEVVRRPLTYSIFYDILEPWKKQSIYGLMLIYISGYNKPPAERTLRFKK